MELNPLKICRNWLNRRDQKKIESLFLLRNDLGQFSEVPLEIVKGKYKGLVYHYGRVEFPEENKVSFEYTALHNEYLIEHLDDFQMFSGRILMHLLENREYYDIIDDEIKPDERTATD